MKIYFAGSIRGGRQDAALYAAIIELLREKGHRVLTEHVGDATLGDGGEAAQKAISEREIFERDCSWVRESDAVVAEVTQTSLGVGYELGLADALGKTVLCLYRPQPGKSLSAMLTGNTRFKIVNYQGAGELGAIFDQELKA